MDYKGNDPSIILDGKVTIVVCVELVTELADTKAV
jgi:hypothetical protein